jgi:UDP-glucose 4-epimerase
LYGDLTTLQNVLVTGGAGFIGSHLVEALLGHGVKRIIVLDNLSCGHEENLPRSSSLEFVHGDIRNIDLVDRLAKKCDTIFHLAEYIPETKKYGPGHVVKYSSENPLEDFEVNTKGTLIVLDAARKHKRKVIFTSTAAVYGNTGLESIAEDTKALPMSPYGASKFCGEIYANSYSRIYGLPIVIARFFNVYGPRQRKYVMYDLLLKIANNPRQLEVLGTGKEERDFIFVLDAVDALLLLAERPEAEGHVFNVGTGVATPVSKVVKLLLHMANVDSKFRFLSESWPGDLRSIVADINKIAALGFKPRFSLEEGTAKLVDWFRKTQLLGHAES